MRQTGLKSRKSIYSILILLVTLNSLASCSRNVLLSSEISGNESVIISYKNATFFGPHTLIIKVKSKGSNKTYRTLIHNDGKALSNQNVAVDTDKTHITFTLTGEEQQPFIVRFDRIGREFLQP